jgi:hypothetical protein
MAQSEQTQGILLYVKERLLISRFPGDAFDSGEPEFREQKG